MGLLGSDPAAAPTRRPRRWYLVALAAILGVALLVTLVVVHFAPRTRYAATLPRPAGTTAPAS
ncbi:hypothetical protein ACFQ0D_22005, partial [Micromonospora zhanjiangensis]